MYRHPLQRPLFSSLPCLALPLQLARPTALTLMLIRDCAMCCRNGLSPSSAPSRRPAAGSSVKMRGTPVTGEGCEGSAGNQNGAVSDLWLGGLVRPSRLACSPQTEARAHYIRPEHCGWVPLHGIIAPIPPSSHRGSTAARDLPAPAHPPSARAVLLAASPARAPPRGTPPHTPG